MSKWIQRPAREWHLELGVLAASRLVLTPCGLSWESSRFDPIARRLSLRGVLMLDRCGPCQALDCRGQEIKRAKTRRRLEGVVDALISRRDPTVAAA